MKRYKLTDQNIRTGYGYKPTQWIIGETQEVSGTGRLCSNGWLHVYTHPLLAVLLNPTHTNIPNPRLFECECEGAHAEDATKEGWQKVTLKREISLPQIKTEQLVTIAILCAKSKKGYHDEGWNAWADKWLSGEDRSLAAAWAAYAAAYAAACAGYAAAYAGYAGYAAAYAEAYAGYAAAYAEDYAEGYAAYAIHYAAADVDLIAIIEQVCGKHKEEEE